LIGSFALSEKPLIFHQPGEVRLTALPPLALYVHIPWCVRKCPYCDFNSHELKGELPEADYVEALLRDVEQALPSIWGRPVTSMFLGGGTPSLLSPDSLDRLLSQLRALLPFEPGMEITLEANPGTVEAGRFRAFRAAGVTRLSLGIQSFDDECLKALGRIHDGREARAAAETALSLFDAVNFDLMYGLPDQSHQQALADVRTAIELGPAHLSAYQLTLEPNTRFWHEPPALPGDDAAYAMQQAIEAALALAGYRHYETSAFAKPGQGCRHNLNYWLFGDYLGVGAGAHSKISFADRIERQARWRHPAEYLQKASQGGPVAERHEVAARDLPFEFMMNALRLNQGFDPALYPLRTGQALGDIEALIDRACGDGLLEREARLLRPSEKGRRFLNDLLQRFLPDQ
jgi:oxygen-independent coproporphyrinogen-3 oxidase